MTGNGQLLPHDEANTKLLANVHPADWRTGKTMDLLLERKANPFVPDARGRLPLHYAAARGAPAELIGAMLAADAEAAHRAEANAEKEAARHAEELLAEVEAEKRAKGKKGKKKKKGGEAGAAGPSQETMAAAEGDEAPLEAAEAAKKAAKL